MYPLKATNDPEFLWNKSDSSGTCADIIQLQLTVEKQF